MIEVERSSVPSPYALLAKRMDALEHAIVEVCDIEIVHAIYERVRMIQKK